MAMNECRYQKLFAAPMPMQLLDLVGSGTNPTLCQIQVYRVLIVCHGRYMHGVSPSAAVRTGINPRCYTMVATGIDPKCCIDPMCYTMV